MGELFSKKAFHMEQTFLGKLMGDGSTWGGLMIALFKGKGSFKNAFFSNLNTINLKVFLKHSGIGFILEVNS